VSPCYSYRAMAECERTFHHLIAHFSTVAGKPSSASGDSPDLCNQIKDLAQFRDPDRSKNRSK
jgi:hypothetical protein